MQPIDNKLYIAKSGQPTHPRPVARSRAARLANATASQRFSILVAGGLAAAAGPMLVSTVADAASLSVSILLEFSHIGLVAFQLFGR